MCYHGLQESYRGGMGSMLSAAISEPVQEGVLEVVTDHGKLTLGNIGFQYPSTRQREGGSGIIMELVPGHEPHAKIQRLDGTSYIRDYNDIGDAGSPTPCQGMAIVKQLYPEVAVADAHQEWPVKQVTAAGWALAQDPWFGRWHWLPLRTEGGDHVYSCTSSVHEVALQGLVLEDRSWVCVNPGGGV